MTSNRFIYFILSAFIAGNLLLIFLQYNSAKNIEDLISGNEKLLHELVISNRLRELEKDMLSAESKIRGAVAANDISYLEGVELQIGEAKEFLNSLRTISDHDSTTRNINRLSELADEKLHLKNQIQDSLYHQGWPSSQSFKMMMQRRKLSSEVNDISRRIYNSRQRLLDSLSVSVNRSGQKARRWGTTLIMLVLVSGAGLFWFIINRIRRQNHLIQMLDSSEKKVREVSLVKENFMTNMSHEIRTPMNAIIGFTNLLKARNQDPRLTELVESIHKSGESLLTIIDDILDLSKIEAGMLRMESMPFSIRGLTHAVQALFAEKVHEKGLLFTVDIDNNIPDTLSGDATRLTQILVNMIGNAVKFTHQGEIRLAINNQGQVGNHTRVGFVISDTGIGIAKEKLSGIFERFRQAEDSITRKYGGTGLGLSIAKDLVLMQKGDITVESEPGKGTTFRFTIPYEIVTGQVAASPQTPVWDYPDSRHVRVLVVEDNDMNQMLLKYLLNEWKLSFDIVNNGMEAIAMLRAGKYNLILMDIQMPVMDGYTATHDIRQKLMLDTPIIAMTAHAFAGEREKCLGFGMNEYIAKPVKERELYRLILQFTGIKAAAARPKTDTNQEDPAAYQLINLRYLRDISEGNKEYEKTITEQFIEVIPLDIAALESAFANLDITSLRQTAHTMKTDVSVMGLSEKLQPWLDTVEYELFDQAHFEQAIAAIKAICLEAMPEARHFYATL